MGKKAIIIHYKLCPSKTFTFKIGPAKDFNYFMLGENLESHLLAQPIQHSRAKISCKNFPWPETLRLWAENLWKWQSHSFWRSLTALLGYFCSTTLPKRQMLVFWPAERLAHMQMKDGDDTLDGA